MKKERLKLPPVTFLLKIGLIVLLVIILICFVVQGLGTLTEQQVEAAEDASETKTVITTSTLEKIIDVDELSTFTAVYNGVARVANAEDAEEIDYYVSYEARVDVGIDLDKVRFEIDDEEKTIYVYLPDMEIKTIAVDIGTMDFMFMNDSVNQSTVTEAAYKACEADAQNECEQENAIYELAAQNAQNTMKALLQPFVEQMEDEYELIVE